MVEIKRQTKETNISVKLGVYGKGEAKINTGIGFFDHMLTALAKHSLMDIELSCEGDREIDDHHSVEDCGIALGQAFAKAVYPVSGIERYGDSVLVMDEAAVSAALDISGRAFLVFKAKMKDKIGAFDSELIPEFFTAFAHNAKITLHIKKQRGKNAHHIAEACFKAVAVALRKALAKNERIGMPSTKGCL